ncbi:Ribosomal-protein-alanine acetyltransferase [Candidatus Propionivibrio aalborgensis]|uniref:[Ribosomal protein bS18]-alanine N-acetyltransferase n=1 Tax=Candidatus Propionivibrio aalborgensis TaxID=1860101 RepID=A0A1A8XQA2_9RHOO|nr:ribosomal protein S18-alanine N-acetyltransferase [Candidatus Propionivibrio aalborgensis]SBT06128.1 Ribosomal-protein-alanine acetyltransferase [Candidatus Propionivibrio aalborgensis]
MNAVLEPCIAFLPMKPADLDEVLAIECRVCPFPWGRGNFSDSMASGYKCRVCRVDGELVGYFVLMLALDDAHLLSISVRETRQRLGYGARLLHQAMKLARSEGATTLLLEVRPSNVKALAMYRHFGFQQIGVRRGYYPAEVGREDALVLTRALAEVSA